MARLQEVPIIGGPQDGKSVKIDPNQNRVRLSVDPAHMEPADGSHEYAAYERSERGGLPCLEFKTLKSIAELKPLWT